MVFPIFSRSLSRSRRFIRSGSLPFFSITLTRFFETPASPISLSTASGGQADIRSVGRTVGFDFSGLSLLLLVRRFLVDEASMDPEFSRLVNQATDIAASGRWATVNARIEGLAANPGENNAWWVKLFAGLCFQNFSEYKSLKRAHENTQNGTATLLAWRARNLLELSVWSNWCAKSRDKARCVYEDAGRDGRDIFDAFMKWGTETAQPTDWLYPIATAKPALMSLPIGAEGFRVLV